MNKFCQFSYEQIDQFITNKNKEQIFLRLSEGFTTEEKSIFDSKLQKYKTIFSDLRNNPKQLETQLNNLRPEIVRLIKKKRTTNPNKQLNSWADTNKLQNMEKENYCGDQEHKKQQA